MTSAQHIATFLRNPYRFTYGRLNHLFNGCPRERHNLFDSAGNFVVGRLDGYITRREAAALTRLMASTRYVAIVPEYLKAYGASDIMNTFFTWKEITDIRRAVRAKLPAFLVLILVLHKHIPFPDDCSDQSVEVQGAGGQCRPVASYEERA